MPSPCTPLFPLRRQPTTLRVQAPFAMVPSSPPAPVPADPQPQRERLLALLRQPPRGACQPHSDEIRRLITALEQSQPADLAQPPALAQLEGVWELRWSSSSQPYLAVRPWLENLQLLAPSQGRAMNLLRLAWPITSLAAIAVEARITITGAEASSTPQQRVAVRFQRGGWLGPSVGSSRLQLLRRVPQPFPAWLDITVLDADLRVCRGNAGTLFALLRRRDLRLEDLLLPLEPTAPPAG